MDFSRQVLFAKLDRKLFKSIEGATLFCKLRGNPYVELGHWLHQILASDDSDMRSIIRHFRLDNDLLENSVAESLNRLPSGASSINDFSHHIDTAIERAWISASIEFDDVEIRCGHLLLALLSTTDLRRILLDICSNFQSIQIQELKKLLASDLNVPLRRNSASNLYDTEHDILFDDARFTTAGERSDQKWLARYCFDLTALAREKKIDPVIGREHEIRTMIDILLRRRQNNPLLTGDAGVGKTAVVEGLALAIANGQVPPALEHVRLLSLDMGALLAGASVKGEFETRLKGVLDEAIASQSPIILFIDEVHTLIGAGGNVGTGDAANLLKPALARGALRTIGATTWIEYKRHIEKDSALTRRFQVLQVPEPEVTSAITMLRGLVDILETHHGVLILDEAVVAAVKFSHRYIPDRQLPDKAISLLDTACARVAVALHASPAPLQMLQFQLSAVQSELDMQKKEHRLGKCDEEQVHKLRKKIVQIEDEVRTQETRWEREKSLTRRILAVRQVISTHALINDASAQAVVKTNVVTGSINDPINGPITSPITSAFTHREESTVSGTQITKFSGADDSTMPLDIVEPVALSNRLHLQGAHIALHVTDCPKTMGIEAASKDSLRKLEAELADYQQDRPLIQSEVNASVIASIVADWTGIPVGRMLKNEIEVVLELSQKLAKRVIGQPSAISVISERFHTARANMGDPDKPIGVFMLVGPSGVGKTETAHAIAEILYGGEQNLITINMNEYQEAHTVSSLKGAPPGYVGYGEGGVLTEAVRRRPYSVVLLDEVEKAHSDVHEVFYQVFDKAGMEDGEGRHVDFRNTVLLLTSNIGSDLLAKLCADPAHIPDTRTLQAALQPELLKAFPAAFIARVCVVPFLPLVGEAITHIIQIHLERICERMLRNHQITLNYSERLVTFIAAQSLSAESGARMPISFIEQRILPELSRYWLIGQGKDAPIKRIWIDVDQDTFVYRTDCNA
ncbi:type VI secretion system ATPase TssH [Glaciimonas immobilis]|uniref:Type VI secretion system protein VasG n=1 Tax=Glaciimonas immobilis TaxID=728004 RepID=A0A840RNF9_9BURK|nr:ATP-dependent Clp protease ATP-binding subunit [Glaciimonas immobilis]KAF3998072.1 ATP-dependent Clp protease ATP-binding subunit [Glaciimonas immobilis]MBB5199235.1 type VI secretion system protein VasG [Glaciimonas immobilis]